MRNKLVSSAVEIFRERARRKEQKKEQSIRKKAPGLTLRDAFARRRAREQAAVDSDSQSALLLPSNTPVLGEFKDGDEIFDDEHNYFDDSGQDEEVLDPAQVQENLKAAAERKRLQNMESKKLQKRFAEKQKLPKYRERFAQRSSLPAFRMKESIVEAIENHSVTVISGDTGECCVFSICILGSFMLLRCLYFVYY